MSRVEQRHQIGQLERERDSAQGRANGIQDVLLGTLEESKKKDERIRELERMLRENLGKDEEVARLQKHAELGFSAAGLWRAALDKLRVDYEKRGQAFRQRRELITALQRKVDDLTVDLANAKRHLNMAYSEGYIPF